MIYGKQYHPQEPKILQDSTPTSPEKLQELLDGGEDMVTFVQQILDKKKLPYYVFEEQVIADSPRKFTLKSKLTQGEQYLAKFITVDPETMVMKEECAKIARTNDEVLVEGETGTGKELIAYSMIGDRKGRIVSINCAGLPSELIEAELFGYVPGAFTGGSLKGAEGLFKQGQDGVVFLDEINSMPMYVQGKLLRALADRKIRRVGGKEDEDINCKFVCASNQDIEPLVTKGTFRKDLYARISTLSIRISPLRDRRCDIIPITESLPGGKLFLEKYGDTVEQWDLSLNVRSLYKYVRQYAVLGRIRI